MMNIENLRDFIFEKMKRELPSTIVYHSVDHTIDVHDAAIRLSQLEGIPDREICLLRAAALLHDVGITVSFEDHERHSVKIAEDYLPSFGYSAEDIEAIKLMIMSTRIPQAANTILEKILCDADLDYLGRPDFFVIAQKLRLEWEYSGNKIELSDWYVIQMNFLRSHSYQTASAKELRNERKLQNLREIENLCTRGCRHEEDGNNQS
ncbi:MAG: HD domain-containing protein [Lentimicrobium sp.]|jgi:predicted metal-dependent HD superfamily phosphohydrolase|nr:HD domain-containing protein [Lentimicrobium sp.]